MIEVTDAGKVIRKTEQMRQDLVEGGIVRVGVSDPLNGWV
jgi:hypothetical protein